MEHTAEYLNRLTELIIDAALAVHRALGPGLLESAYEACLYYELVKRRLPVERQKALPLAYEGVKLNCSYRMDLVVDNAVVVEVKSVAKFDRVHEAQILSYLKIAGLRVGLIFNFNVRNLTHQGILRRVNNFPE